MPQTDVLHRITQLGKEVLPPGGHFNDNTYTTEQWTVMESAGAVFLPAAGFRWGSGVYDVGWGGNFWSATPYDTGNAYYLNFNSGHLNPQSSNGRNNGFSVRLVR